MRRVAWAVLEETREREKSERPNENERAGGWVKRRSKEQHKKGEFMFMP